MPRGFVDYEALKSPEIQELKNRPTPGSGAGATGLRRTTVRGPSMLMRTRSESMARTIFEIPTV